MERFTVYALAVLLVLASGCGRRTSLRELSFGRYSDPQQALFDRALGGVQILGYTPSSVDAVHGLIVVPSSYRSRREGGAEIRIQLYREGWIGMTVAGGPVRRDGNGRAQVPGELESEYRALALGLREHVEGRERGALGR
jgi:hypothetical protein